MNLRDLLPVLQLAIGPVIVISGVGLVMLSMTNRYGRVIDRSRQLADALRAAGPSGRAETLERLGAQVRILVRRARLLRSSIILAATCLLLAALLVIGLFVTALARIEDATHIVVLFAGCMATLIASLAIFIYDINLSLAALELEVRAPGQEGGSAAPPRG
jgi:hypothetical protein